jgi:small subunit ribosomal protein S4e
MHRKRSGIPKAWPLPRKAKGKRYVAMPAHKKSSSLSILCVLRDILGIAQTKKEAKHILHNEGVKINNNVRKSVLFPVQIFDTISIEKLGKYYRLEIVNRKFTLKEIKAAEAEKKVVKISGKKILGPKEIQMNLEDGTNLNTKDKFNVGDSVIYNTSKNTVEKVLPLKVDAKVEIVSGKHAGEKGTIKKIIDLAREKAYEIKLETGKVTLPFKTLMVIE